MSCSTARTRSADRQRSEWWFRKRCYLLVYECSTANGDGRRDYRPDSTPGVVSGEVYSCCMVDRLVEEILHAMIRLVVDVDCGGRTVSPIIAYHNGVSGRTWYDVRMRGLTSVVSASTSDAPQPFRPSVQLFEIGVRSSWG